MYIVAGWGNLPVSRVISCMTMNPFAEPRWGPSHVAIIVRTTPAIEDLTGETHLWVESSTLLPRECLIAKRKVIGLQCHRIGDRWGDYPKGNIHLYSLKYPLTPALETALVNRIFNDWMKHSRRSSCPFLKRILFGRYEAQLCSEFVQNVMVAVGRSSIKDNRPYRSPAAFLRYHLQKNSIVPESR